MMLDIARERNHISIMMGAFVQIVILDIRFNNKGF